MFASTLRKSRVPASDAGLPAVRPFSAPAARGNFAAFAGVALTLVVAACSSSTSPAVPASSGSPDGGTAAGSCGSPGRTGKSSCYKVMDACSAGQYCANGNGTGCSVGCVSEDNCGATEHCVRCGMQSVGTCRSCTDKNDGCTVTPEPDAGPVDPCMRDTGIDFMCKPALPKAYHCFGSDPLQTGCVHGTGDPTVFCCAK